MVYAYRPLSLEALSDLVIHEALGHRARFERFAAEMLYMIAAGVKIDMNRSERFSKQIDEIYRNPFVRQTKQPETAEEIKQYILHKIEEAREWI